MAQISKLIMEARAVPTAADISALGSMCSAYSRRYYSCRYICRHCSCRYICRYHSCRYICRYYSCRYICFGLLPRPAMLRLCRSCSSISEGGHTYFETEFYAADISWKSLINKRILFWGLPHFLSILYWINTNQEMNAQYYNFLLHIFIFSKC